MSLPLVYCPPTVRRPAWAAEIGPFGRLAAAGGGVCWHGPWREGAWRQHPAGWQVLLDGHKPQHLLRARRHPRVLRVRELLGAEPDHAWLVPVLLQPVGDAASANLFAPAVDLVWRGGDWRIPDDLDHLVRDLLDLANKAPAEPSADPAEANRRLAATVAAGLALTHHCDLELLDLTGWLSANLMSRAVDAMCGLPC
jgi:hypothetical protein